MSQKLTPELPPSCGASYYLVKSYDYTNGSSFFVTSMPMPSAQENHIIADKLGRHGFMRIQQFRDYVPGWDFGHGQSMSEIGFNVLAAFLKKAKLPEGKKPSVFMTTSGHLELAWENEAGAKIQAEFGPKNIEFYREDTGDEGQLGITQIPEAAKILTA